MKSVKHPFLAGALALAAATGLSLGVAGAQDHKGHDHAGHAHAEHVDGPAEVGKPAPNFTLTDTEGKEHSLHAYLMEGKTVVLEWFNPDCPFVQKLHKNSKTMSETRAMFAEKNVVWLAVNSGAPGKQGAGVERNKKAIEDFGIGYPLLLDESGEVGKKYGAKTTPQIFVIDPKGTLLFDGPLDDVADAAKIGEKNYVKEVLSLATAGKPVEPRQIKSYGCSVKYAS